MEIVQRRFTNRATFVYENDGLMYAIKDSSGSRSFSVEYGSIPNDLGELEEKNPWYRNVGIFWVGLGVLQITLRFFEHGNFKRSIWLPLGILCFFIYWVATTKYSIIDTDKGRIFIIKNQQHDQIQNQLIARKKAQLRLWYGEVDLHNDPVREIGKFRWLKNQGIISISEYQSAINQVSQHHGVQVASEPIKSIGQTIN